MADINIATRIKILRKEAGYTQESVSKILNVTRAAYSNYETGNRNPPLECIISLAKLYSTTVDSILGYSSVAESAATNESSFYSLSEDEIKFLELYRKLSLTDKKEILNYVQYRLWLNEHKTFL